MPKFYFTYGTSGQPYYGGWTEVNAPDGPAACAAFRAYHPDKLEGFLNCASVYSTDQFLQSAMAGPSGNFGKRCHEIISIQRKVISGEDENGEQE